MKIKNTTLAKIALRVSWDTNPTAGLIYHLRQEYPHLSDSQIYNLITRVYDSGLIKQVWKPRGHYEKVGKYELVDGIFEEML